MDADLIEAIARVLVEAGETLPGTCIPVITAEDLAKVALATVAAAGFDLVRRGPG
ncbi:hypothetical protein M0638_26770 [Roseomonas sp. NAR14]|uniref:Uncharacterized protein n=1 Tax=Roseomonas acroporae TaxID=2937791 RepID=A0A9X2BWM6_9PROT|nr:hypothetical protein [Roseomonas acroporae]MCK8787963.1 hypothetical protein [Roseomonas acroporae]